MKAKYIYGYLRSILSFLLVLVAVLSLFGCQESVNEENIDDFFIKDEVKQLDYELDEPLVIFHSTKDNSIIQNFINNYPEIPIKTYHIGTIMDVKGLEECIKQYGEPDIILDINTPTAFNQRYLDWYSYNLITDISEYKNSDNSIDDSDYIPGTFEAISYDEALVGIPLSWQKRCIVVNDSKWKDSEFSFLPEDYTGKELYTALLNEANKGRNDEEYLWGYSYSYLMDDLYELNAIQEDKDSIVIDKEIFQIVYDFNVKKEEEKDKMNRISTHPALDPDVLSGSFLGSSLLGAPQIEAIYAKSAADARDEETHLYWIPIADSSNQYIGEVKDIAFLGANSARKQQAYDVIRLMMDMPVEVIIQPKWEGSPQTSSPVNINRAIELLNFFDESEGDLVLTSFAGNLIDTVERKNLSKSEKQKVVELIKGMVDLQFEFNEQESYYVGMEYINSTASGNDLKYEECYSEIISILNLKE